VLMSLLLRECSKRYDKSKKRGRHLHYRPGGVEKSDGRVLNAVMEVDSGRDRVTPSRGVGEMESLFKGYSQQTHSKSY